MALNFKSPVRTKTIIDSNIFEQVSNFSYVGIDVTCIQDTDLISRLNKYEKVSG
jgi:hypothetical protein